MKFQKTEWNPETGETRESEFEVPDNIGDMTDEQFAQWFAARSNIIFALHWPSEVFVEEALRDLEIVDSDGNTVGPLLGFVVIPGKTMKESIQASLPSGHTIRWKARI